jgi:hypothetical protein
MDAFDLLFGRAPVDMTGAPEGALLGAAVGFGAWLGGPGEAGPPLRRCMGGAGFMGAVAGGLVVLSGGRLMGGSLDLLARGFPGSRLDLDRIGALFGEPDFGPLAHGITAGLEGLLFGACVVGAMIVARRALDRRR